MAKKDSLVRSFMDRYMSGLPWDFLVSPASPKMSLWIHNNGVYELMESSVTPPADVRAFELPTVKDLKNKVDKKHVLEHIFGKGA